MVVRPKEISSVLSLENQEQEINIHFMLKKQKKKGMNIYRLFLRLPQIMKKLMQEKFLINFLK
jgi:hypothetical protein